ncbi:MAG: hypothetical protein ACXAB8_19680 [Promethearchaeota archaeon]
MLDKKRIILITASILCIVVAILMIYKNSAVVMAIQQRVEILSGLGTTFEAEGVNISIAYLSITLSIIIAVVAILGSLLSFKSIKFKEIHIGPILIVGVAIFSWIGIFIPVIETSFTVSIYTFYVDIDLVETLIGIGEPILLSISGALTIFAEF